KKFADEPSLLRESLQACVGPAAGVEAAAFVDNLERLPDIDAIVRGESTEMPEEVDLQYAIASALVGRAVRAKESGDGAAVYGRILEYAGRFPQREMGVMLVSDMHRAVGQDLFNVPEFSPWAQSVAEVML
ncbi:MAG TPA: ATPase, partial [Gammaproteobacteria bacterium]|nr:ATPase [Gammaproteobacteria bacterium]